MTIKLLQFISESIWGIIPATTIKKIRECVVKTYAIFKSTVNVKQSNSHNDTLRNLLHSFSISITNFNE